MGLNTLLITQARTGSTRLPGKVLKIILGKTLLQIHLERLSKCKLVDAILVATTSSPDDNVIYKNAIDWGYYSFAGSEDDVLDRFYQAALPHSPTWVVRVTSDCPLIDPALVDKVVRFSIEKNADYCSNTLLEHYPDGQDIEVFKFEALSKAWKLADKKSEREHVTPFIRNNSDFKGGQNFVAVNFPCEKNYSHIRMTVDEQKDLDLITRLTEAKGLDKSWLDYTNYIIDHDLLAINKDITRNEGLLKSLSKEE
ncbi:MAG: glycosyltransferase family protein [Imperialibacter sp.]|uniref:glycosyltransferase family protein n=1 Tax=Imperialibacter sp. TaxID=2038411 RepID=UPI0032EC0A51